MYAPTFPDMEHGGNVFSIFFQKTLLMFSYSRQFNSLPNETPIYVMMRHLIIYQIYLYFKRTASNRKKLVVQGPELTTVSACFKKKFWVW